jgi:hypothetical protein
LVDGGLAPCSICNHVSNFYLLSRQAAAQAGTASFNLEQLKEADFFYCGLLLVSGCIFIQFYRVVNFCMHEEEEEKVWALACSVLPRPS